MDANEAVVLVTGQFLHYCQCGIYNQFMKQFLDRFILGFPVIFLKQYPYAWLAIVALWPHSPALIALLFLIIVIGVFSLRWQSAAWISHMRRLYAGRGGKFYLDQPRVPWIRAARNISFLIGGSAITAFLLKGQFGLSFWQYVILLVGFTVLYQDTQFFGRHTTYIITATGIAIRFVPGLTDYRLFLPFKEISRIERSPYKASLDTDLFARTRDVKEGLLMIAKDPKGFTRWIQKLFIAPNDLDKFLEQLPYGFGGTV